MENFDAKNTIERLETLIDPRLIMEDIKARLISGQINTDRARIEIESWKKQHLTTSRA